MLLAASVLAVHATCIAGCLDASFVSPKLQVRILDQESATQAKTRVLIEFYEKVRWLLLVCVDGSTLLVYLRHD